MKIHWPSALQLGLSLLVVVNLWGLAAGLAMLGLGQRLAGVYAPAEALSTLMLAMGFGLIGLVALPSAAFAFLRLAGRPASASPTVRRWLRPGLLVFTLPFLLAAGAWVAQVDILSWAFLPLLHILAVCVSVFWLAYLATRDLPFGSPQRAWGVLASGVSLGPLLIFLTELAVIFSAGLLLAMWLSFQPGMEQEMASLAERLSSSGFDPAIMRNILLPYLARPWVIFSAFAFIAVLVPLIEELIKPIGVWLLAGRSLSPAEGFAAGALSGAGFALAETLASGAQAHDWAYVIFARMGTSAVHILATALTGWALASAWRYGRYLQLAVTYLGAVLLHGLWNGLTILAISTDLPVPLGHVGLTWLAPASQLAPYGLVGLALAALVGLLLSHHWISKVKNGVH